MDTMDKVSRILETQYPVLADPDYLEQEGRADSEAYWFVQHAFQNLYETFDMTIYLNRRVNGQLQTIIAAGPDYAKKYDPEVLFSQFFEESYIDPLIPLVYKTKSVQIAKKPYTNEFGTMVSEYRPIIKDGEVVTVLELDYDVSFVWSLRWRVTWALLISLGLAVMVAGIFALVLSGSLIRPIMELADHARQIGGGDLDCRITIKGKDEIAELGNILNKMVANITEYISNLNQITAEKERINSELTVASNIQNDMLPRIFPHFSGHEHFQIYAKMTAAKEVGGDFYDFFFLDDKKTKITFVIADVSGKGVPAALFMVIVKTLIKNQAMTGKGLDEVFYTVNNQLCENNDESMFATAFACTLDLNAGKLSFANAGHNRPLIALSGGPYEFLELKKGLPLAVGENTKYQSVEIDVKAGDKLYLYTDGINEAENAEGDQFGNQRLIDTANAYRDLPPADFDAALRNALAAFTKGFEQSDDITTIAVSYETNL
jgi:sigma-B regulation protein RsbU (phosphoserine phosphatase)